MKTRRWLFLALIGCSVFMTATGAVSIVGHWCECPVLYTWGSGHVEGMALNTSVLFIVGGMVLLGLLLLIDP